MIGLFAEPAEYAFISQDDWCLPYHQKRQAQKKNKLKLKRILKYYICILPSGNELKTKIKSSCEYTLVLGKREGRAGEGNGNEKLQKGVSISIITWDI